MGRDGLTSLALGGYFAVARRTTPPACIGMQVIWAPGGGPANYFFSFALLGVPRALCRLILPTNALWEQCDSTKTSLAIGASSVLS